MYVFLSRSKYTPDASPTAALLRADVLWLQARYQQWHNSYSRLGKTYIYELGPTRVSTKCVCGPKGATNFGHRTNMSQLRRAKALDKSALSPEENKGSQTPGA